MPVAIKLSKRFYDTFGQEVTDELVDALNAVDSSYRAEFRELFSAHFGQLRAEMGKLGAELRGDISRQDGRLATFEQRFETFEQRYSTFEQRFATFDQRFATFEQKVGGDLKAMKSELIGWVVGLWLGTGALGLLIRAWAR